MKTALGTYTGKYTPKNKTKCVNVAKYGALPIYRSSWEVRVFEKLDMSPNVILWGSELPETIIQYPSPFEKNQDGSPKIRNYHPDIFIRIQTARGLETILIEIKPLNQSVMPEMPKRKTKSSMNSYNRQLSSYILNTSKWKCASQWCVQRGYRFLVLTEQQILNL